MTLDETLVQPIDSDTKTESHHSFDSFKSAIPEPFQVLGLELKPLSIGRYRRMARHGVAFVSETETSASIADLLLGVVICSMRCDEFDSSVLTPKFWKDLHRWSKHLNPHAWIGVFPILGKWWRKNHSFNFVEKMQLFKRYIDEAQLCPEYIVKNESNSGGSASHWSHSIEIVLRGELGWTKEEIEEAPLSKALSDYFKHMENQGMITILTEEDMKIGRANADKISSLETV